MGKRPRDNQRRKVYKAEKFFCFPNPRPEPMSLDECYDFAKMVLDDVGCYKALIIKDGRGCRSAWADWYTSRVMLTLPKFARNKRIILHELAHCLVDNTYQAHGPEFCRVYFELVKRFYGAKEAGELLYAFKMGRVKVAPSNSRGFTTEARGRQQLMFNGV